jgi:glucose-1-phosphate thymidylyltransferase
MYFPPRNNVFVDALVLKRVLLWAIMAPVDRITKGIILAAGAGTRLSPATLPISKILLPVYDRPMVYYPLSTLIMAGIRDILVITNESDRENFERTLRDGSQFGVRITYEVQYVQRGISDAFIVGERFIDGDPCVLVLGDNIFCGDDMEGIMCEAAKDVSNATVFARWVPDPDRFGVAEFDSDGKVISLEEKPTDPKSNYAVVGLYFYPGDATAKAKTLKPSSRGELEITDLNRLYLDEGNLRVKTMGNLTMWIDAGTFGSLLESAEFVRSTEKRFGIKVLCPEIEALKKGFVSKEEMEAWVASFKKNDYYEDITKFMERM